MTQKILNEEEIEFLKALNYLSNNLFGRDEGYLKNNKIKIDFITNFFDNYFTKELLDIKEECYEHIEKCKLEEGSAIAHLSRRMNQAIDKLQFHYSSDKFCKDTELESAYKTIMDLFGIYKWVNVGSEFDLIAFLFKCRGSNKNGTFTLEEARILCEELSEILNRKELSDEFDKIMYEVYYNFSQREILNKMTTKRINEIFSHQESLLIPIEKYNYDEITKVLFTYIRGGNRLIYKKIIEEHILPEHSQPLTMRSGNLSDIVRFADCFNISLPIISIIFDAKVEHKNRVRDSVTPFLRDLRKFNPNLYKEKSTIS